MGAEKALLEFENRPLICWTVEKLSLAVDEVIVVARDEAHAERLQETIWNFALRPEPGVIFTWDRIAGFGPVAGLSAGMKKARGNFAFATGCDLPFLNPKVIERLFELVNEDEEGYDAAVPVRPNGFFEPLHCVYHRKKMLSACERALERAERRIHAPLQEPYVRRILVDLLRPIDPDLLSFFNLNTREDLQEARALWPNGKDRKEHQYLCKHECDISDVVL
jgi:molybdopterin-guanine dinucleotide biosynthesis protein A